MLLDAISLNTSPLFWLTAGVAVTCLGLSKSGFIGSGLIATPLFALVVPSVEAAAILLPVMLIQDYFAAHAYRRDWDRPTLVRAIPGAVIGIGLAWMVATHFSDAILSLTVGIIALVLVLRRWFSGQPSELAKQPAPFLGLIWGAISGFTGTLANAGGPPFLAYLLPQKLAKITFVGTMALYCASINTMKVLPFFALGQFSIRNLATSAVLLPCALTTTFLGVRLVHVIRTEVFYQFTYAMILLISLALIWRGAATMPGLSLWGN